MKLDMHMQICLLTLKEELSQKNLIQLVKLPTWSRLVGLIERQSVLNHIYIFKFQV